ncbi:MAG TPA: hypothetical protein VFV10_15865 [Gammaproteobacteria bacterium]|nr:hypothetical protein [Gammaproteobacteria bacterium]
MRDLGNGRFEDVEGRIHTIDAEDAFYETLERCLSCEHELADGEDGICSFCREDEAVAARYREHEEALHARQRAQAARLVAWVQADPARRATHEAAQVRLAELRRARKGAAA